MFVGGAAISWLKHGLRLIYNAAECDLFASLVHDDQRIYVVPSFTGLGAPYWDSYSRGAIFGLERSSKREHLVKATLESIAYQSNDLIYAMQKDLGQKIKVLKVDGGATKSNYLMQFQASISNLEVHRPINVETTAMGACYLAGLAVGFWNSIDELKTIAKVDQIFYPKWESNKIQTLLKGWNQAVKRTLNWTKEIE